MYRRKKVSVVFATYREKNSVRKVINDFFDTGFVDEIIVVNNNAEKGTIEEIRKTKAKIINDPRQGYGFAFQTGIEHAKGDYIILCEPDGSYVGADLEKFLVYAQSGYEIVLGSRTNQITLLSGADMTFSRKYANFIEAKTIEVFFNTNSLSDIGCTFKLFKKSTLKKLSKRWKTTNSLFATELVLLTATQNVRFIEIPVTFKKRVGISIFTNTFLKTAKWGIHIQLFILWFWTKWTLKKLLE